VKLIHFAVDWQLALNTQIKRKKERKKERDRKTGCPGAVLNVNLITFLWRLFWDSRTFWHCLRSGESGVPEELFSKCWQILWGSFTILGSLLLIDVPHVDYGARWKGPRHEAAPPSIAKYRRRKFLHPPEEFRVRVRIRIICSVALAATRSSSLS